MDISLLFYYYYFLLLLFVILFWRQQVFYIISGSVKILSSDTFLASAHFAKSIPLKQKQRLFLFLLSRFGFRNIGMYLYLAKNVIESFLIR